MAAPRSRWLAAAGSAALLTEAEAAAGVLLQHPLLLVVLEGLGAKFWAPAALWAAPGCGAAGAAWWARAARAWSVW